MALIVAEDDVPRGVGRVRAGNHIFGRAEVIVPLLAVAIVLGRHLVALVRRILAGLETPHLLFLGNVNPDLQHDHAGFRQAGLVVVDFGISAGPFGVGGEAFDAFDHDTAVPRAVENREMPRGGRLVPEAPEVVTGFFFGRRGGCRVDLIVSGVDHPAESADGAALTRGVGALKGDDGAEALGRGEPGESAEAGLQFGDLGGVVFSIKCRMRGDAFEEAARSTTRLLVLHGGAAPGGQGKLAHNLDPGMEVPGLGFAAENHFPREVPTGGR